MEALVSALESNPEIGGVQGVILTWDGERIDSYGVMMSDHGNFYPIGYSMSSAVVSNLKPIAVTHAIGSYSVYKVEAIEKCGGLFLPYFFMWGDDYELGIRLWRYGYVVMAIPVAVGRHYRGATTSSLSSRGILEYWFSASKTAVMVFMHVYGYYLFLKYCRELWQVSL